MLHGYRPKLLFNLPQWDFQTRCNAPVHYFVHSRRTISVVRCAIWYHLYNLKNVKNTHEGVLVLVKLQAEIFTLMGSD